MNRIEQLDTLQNIVIQKPADVAAQLRFISRSALSSVGDGNGWSVEDLAAIGPILEGAAEALETFQDEHSRLSDELRQELQSERGTA